MKNALLAILICFLFISCNEKHDIIASFCYWKTDLNLDKEDQDLIQKLNAQHMYVRFFDVDWSFNENEAIPVATIRNLKFNTNKLKITPSIFITNEVFLKTTKQQLDTLAFRIAKRVEEIVENELNTSGRKINYEEILIDCDWSPKSKDNYFYLLKQIKNNFPNQKIAATIRLWQYKYATKAGMPPVDRGLLMCYNMSKPNDFKTENSIATSSELAQFLTHKKYRLKLDIALPIYSWAVIFRGNKYKGIVSDYHKILNKDLKLKKLSSNKYLLQQDILVGRSYLRNGDIIRVEKISNEELDKMISIIKSKIQIDNATKVTFFSFDKIYVNDYGTEKISKYYARF